ncbi:unnamed protein product [Fusarium graminearum]|nr:unnamed protein product [Fusarium graminearum]
MICAFAVQSVHEAKCVNSSSDLSNNEERNRGNLGPFETKWYVDNVLTHGCETIEDVAVYLTVSMLQTLSLKFEANSE